MDGVSRVPPANWRHGAPAPGRLVAVAPFCAAGIPLFRCWIHIATLSGEALVASRCWSRTEAVVQIFLGWWGGRQTLSPDTWFFAPSRPHHGSGPEKKSAADMT